MSNEGAALAWGLKQSFRSYVESAGGTIETGDGAERLADGAFLFQPAPGEGLRLGAGGAPEGTGRFLGEVRCEAHGGMLKVFLADPIIAFGADAAVLTVADSAARDNRVTLADLDVAAATRDDDGWLTIPTKLARDGWRVLGDHYAYMTPLDPVRLRLS